MHDYTRAEVMERSIDNLRATVIELEGRILCLTETATENSRIKVEDHTTIVNLQNEVERKGRMIAAQQGLRESLRSDCDRFRQALEAMSFGHDTICCCVVCNALRN